MSKQYKTEQEKFWASQEWGNEYIQRNTYKKVKNNINLFTKVLNRTKEIKTIIEFGSNIGINLLGLKQLLPDAEYSAIEINSQACKELEKLKFIMHIYNQTIFDSSYKRQQDLVLVKGVLIHINPEYLDIVYQKLYETSKKYILIVEYYNPTPVKVAYRGENEKLYKRDFAGEMLNKFPNLELIDYGFTYHRDNNFPLDDSNWFLMEKR